MANDGTIKINTELDSSKAKSAMSNFSSTAKNALHGVAVAASVAGAAISAMAVYSIKVGSDFEAGMSKVSAISGATGSDLEALSDKAKEMGAKTKFSATDAASAFEYMAMAGWKTEDMLNGIEGIMNLAAASGEDLATTSDIVTDALTAFGLSASDSAHFADVLAQAASSSNTNVGLLGATFKYAAPIAGALKYSIEDTAVAIGLMANAGIKGEQAGTALRAMLTRLADPPKDAADALEAMGITVTNADGTMKPLMQTLQDLRNGFSGLDDSQKASYASAIAGQEAMSGLLAIVGASDTDFNNLVTAINNADGAAKDMAETMQNNLKGSVTILGSALEGFGIQVYERIQAPLKEAVDTGTECVNRLSKAFQSGGLNGVVKEAGQIFNELTDRVAGTSKAAAGIVTPLKNVTNAAGSLAKTILPPMAQSVKLLAENFDVLAPVIAASVTGFKAYNAIAKSTNTVTEAYAASKALLTKMEKANALQLVATNGGLTVQQYLIAAGNGQLGIRATLTGLCAKAQTALNAAISANPIGLMLTVMAAATAGLLAYVVATDHAKNKTYELSNSEKELLNSCKESTEALNEQRAAREESVQSVDMEYDGYQTLLSELRSITDENGRVKAGYEERAGTITGQLSEALGIEIGLIDGVIQMNGQSVESMQEVCNAIDEVIVKKKAEALCAALQEEMVAAYKNSKDALLEYKEAVSIAAEKEDALTEAKNRLKDVEELYAGNTGPKAIAAIREAEQAVDDAQTAFDKASETVDGTSKTLNELSTEVNNYNDLVRVMEEGTISEIESAMTALLAGYESYTEEMLATSQTARDEMYAQARETTDILRVLVDEGGQTYLALGETAANAAANAVSEFQKLPNGVEEAINEIGTDGAAAMVAALAQADFDGKLTEESKASYEAFLMGLSDLPAGTQKAMSSAVEGAMAGLKGFDQIQDKAEKEGISFLEALREVLQVNSPSKKVMEIFEGVWEGASDGLDTGKEELNTKGTKVCNSFLDTLRNSLGTAMQEIGSNIVSFFGLGVSSQTGAAKGAGSLIASSTDVGAASIDPTPTGNIFGSNYASGVSGTTGAAIGAGNLIATSADSAAGSINPTPTGSSFGSNYASGVSGTRGIAIGAGNLIATSADNAAGSINPTGTGGKFGSQYSSGVSGTRGAALGAGSEIASSADSGAKSYSGYDAGSSFGSGFVGGIAAWISSAAQKAAALARAALNAAKQALDSHSPSKEAKKIGRTLPQGFSVGIEEDAKLAEKASAEMAENTLDALNLDDIYEKLKSVDVSGAISRIHMAVDDRQSKIADKVVASVGVKEGLAWSRKTESDTHFSEADIEKLAKEIGTVVSKAVTAGINGSTVTMDKKVVGKLLTPEIDKNLNPRKV